MAEAFLERMDEACRRLGFWAYRTEAGEWVPCDADHPDARPDLDRLIREGPGLIMGPGQDGATP